MGRWFQEMDRWLGGYSVIFVLFQFIIEFIGDYYDAGVWRILELQYSIIFFSKFFVIYQVFILLVWGWRGFCFYNVLFFILQFFVNQWFFCWIIRLWRIFGFQCFVRCLERDWIQCMFVRWMDGMEMDGEMDGGRKGGRMYGGMQREMVG